MASMIEVSETLILKSQWIGYNWQGAEHMQRVYILRDAETWEPVQYGPAVPTIGESYNMMAVMLEGMDPIQECEGCMTGFNPAMLTVRPSGAVLCEECCAIEDGD